MSATHRPPSRVLAAAPAVIAWVVVAGGGLLVAASWLPWGVGMDPPTGVMPLGPNEALGLTFVGTGLLFARSDPLRRHARWVAAVVGVGITLTALLTLAEYVSGRDLGIGRLLLPDPAAGGRLATPGRPAFTTALALALLGSALLALGVAPRRGPLLSQLPAVTAALIALLALLGHAAGVPSFYGVITAVAPAGMSVVTAALVVLLAAGVVSARPEHGLMAILRSGGADGATTRRLLLVPVVLPLATGLLNLQGRRYGLYPVEFGGWLFSFANVAVFTLIIWSVAAALRRTDMDRLRAEGEVRRLNAELEGLVATRTAELRGEEGLFRSAFDHSHVAMVITDLSNRFIRVNAAFAHLFGYTPDEVLRLGLADVTHPDHLTDSLEQRERLLSGSGEAFQMEKRYRHKDGRELWGLTNVALVRDPDRRPLLYVGQVQDITERKAAEQAVREREVALLAANAAMAEKTAENEMFVYSVSHDLRSPLVNLQGFSKELEKAGESLTVLLATDGVPTEVRSRGEVIVAGKLAKSIGFIQSAVLRLSNIIEALLRLSRAGRVEYRWQVVDASGVMTHVLAAAQGTIAERKTTVRVGDLPPAWGDRTAIEQLFGNLVGNALAYLDPTRPGFIEVGAADAPVGSHTFYVRDNGLGIAETHRAKIFQPFQRAHPGVGGGEGLGLAIVARVVERHRGRVWVESTPGVGSTFFITLPAPPGGRGDSG